MVEMGAMGEAIMSETCGISNSLGKVEKGRYVAECLYRDFVGVVVAKFVRNE